MKLLFFILAFLFSFQLFSQTDDQQYEHAFFLVRNGNEIAYTTNVTSNDLPFSEAQFYALKSKLMQKEGIFKVSLGKEMKTITVFHLSYIEVETIKFFIEPFKPNSIYSERIEYTF